ncbi:hypothetical protein [Streptomyces sp. NPDC021356]|uniref:hypothetical protein n=1 Tax=Streptomyces sp. NPDC021356 TaxID=3154900 RepID=UPI0033DFBB30
MRRTAAPRALSAVALAGLIAGSGASAVAAAPAADRPAALAGPLADALGRPPSAGLDGKTRAGGAVRAAERRGPGAAEPGPVPGDGLPGFPALPAPGDAPGPALPGPGDAPAGPALPGPAPRASGPDGDVLLDPAEDPLLQDALAHDPAVGASSPALLPDRPAGGVSSYDATRGASPGPSRDAPSAASGRDQATHTSPARTPALGEATRGPATRDPAARDSAPRDPATHDSGSACGDRAGGGAGDRAGGGDCPGTAAEHGVQAGTGGSLTASLPALIGGGALIALALCGAAHRMWRHRRADG